MDWKAHITSDPEILGGRPAIKGTRLTVDFILSLFAEGWSEKQVLDNYPQLSTDDLRSVFGFAQSCMADEEYISLRKVC
ncbi:MAG: DUF433 domain-containing protein [Thiohalomonadaceae bacterium]